MSVRCTVIADSVVSRKPQQDAGLFVRFPLGLLRAYNDESIDSGERETHEQDSRNQGKRPQGR